MASSLEHAAQVAVIAWANYNIGRYPKLRWLFAIPNGGQRDIRVARKLKAEGVKAGVPDLFLPVSNGVYHGLFIEMKVGRNKPTGKQIEWCDYLGDAGYKVGICYGSQEAIETLEKYLDVVE